MTKYIPSIERREIIEHIYKQEYTQMTHRSTQSIIIIVHTSVS